MKVMTIIGTRPEIIRLASVIKKLDQYCDQVLVHTGQNYDHNLMQIFFEDLELRQPDYILETRADSLHGLIGNIITQTGNIMEKEKPDAVLVLGDTNSALSVINAKRMKIPVYHMEAGDRSFDENVPEELNRRIVDHTADINLAYTEHSRRNLIREGIHPSKIYVTGTPIMEVYQSLGNKFFEQNTTVRLGLTPFKYIIASVHREENVDSDDAFRNLVMSYNALAEHYKMPVVVSTHPRTMRRLKDTGLLAESHELIMWHEPFGLLDFLNLQINAFCTVSDSGTIHEDSSILAFKAVAIRRSTEKQESIDSGHCVICGLNPESVLRSVDLAINDPATLVGPAPAEYQVYNVSSKIVRVILGMNDVVKEKRWSR